MRRNEFLIKDNKILSQVLDEADYGILGLIDGEKPYTVPLNFVWIDGVVYFHGSPSGKKMKALKSGVYASFSVVKELSLIPSYFTGAELACPATQFFLSVHIDAKIHLIEDIEEKIYALEVLMKKLQPEGKYRPISSEDEEYKRELRKVSIVKLETIECNGKFKLGQHLSDETWNLLTEELKKRGSRIDLITLELMKEFKPKK